MINHYSLRGLDRTTPKSAHEKHLAVSISSLRTEHHFSKKIKIPGRGFLAAFTFT